MRDSPFQGLTGRWKRAILAAMARRKATSMRVATRAERPIDMRAVLRPRATPMKL